MPETGYQTKIYGRDNGNELVVAVGGLVTVLGDIARGEGNEVRVVELAKASGAQNRMDLSGVLKDSAGAIVPNGWVLILLSDDATDGAGLSDYSPSTAAPTQTTGKLYPLVANATTTVVALLRASALGTFELRYTDTAQEPFVLVALPLSALLAGGDPTLLEIEAADYTD